VPAADAVIIDSTHLTLEQVIGEVERLIEQRLSAKK
jgi:cytidylate kinase